MNVASDLFRFEAASDRPILVAPDGTTQSYADAALAARKVASLFTSAGVAPGDRVLLLMPNGIEYLAGYYGALMLRAIAVPIAPSSTADYAASVAAICAPVLALVADDRSAAVVRGAELPTLLLAAPTLDAEGPVTNEVRPGPASDIAQIIFTSGTTGAPKGVALSHGALASNTTGIVEYLALHEFDRVGVVLDFVYSYGNSLLQTHVRVGGSLALLGPLTFTKQVVQRLVAAGCTGFAGVPSTFALLLRQGSLAGPSAPSLRYLTCAGGALPVETIQRLRALLPDVELFLMYGQTEASARLSYLPPSDLDARPWSIGRGMPGARLEVLLVDGSVAPDGVEGEIVAEGANLMSGYWGDPDGTADAVREGRLWTGDLASRDADGYLAITGRRSELIKTAAYRVHPKEIKEAILEMDGVHECAVVGVPGELMGEAVVACFANDAAPPLAQIRTHLRGRIPEYKWPRLVVTVAECPRTSSGKVKRKELSALASTALAATG